MQEATVRRIKFLKKLIKFGNGFLSPKKVNKLIHI